MVIKNDLAYFGYIGYIFLVSLPSVFLAFYMNRRRIRLLGLYAPVVFTLCMLKVMESNIRLTESGSLEASLLMFFYGFPLIIGSLIFTLIRLHFVYSEKLWKGMLIFLSYILGPLLVGVLGLYVVMLFQLHQFIFLVIILMILVSYLPPIYLYYFDRDQKDTVRK